MSTQIVVPNEDSAQLARLVSDLSSPLVRQAQEMTIETSEDYEMVASFKQLVATKRKALKTAFDYKNTLTAHPIVVKTRGVLAAAQAAWAEVVKPFDRGIEELAEVDRILDPKIQAYDEKMERLNREQAAREAAEEKKRLDDAAIEEAQQLEAAGEHELAEQVMQQAAEAPPPVVVLPPATPNVGQQFHKKTTYKFRIVNVKLIPQQMLLPPDQHLNDPDWYPRIAATVKAQGQMARISGIEVYPEKKFVGQSAK
jgi:hypothetical protein